MSKNEVLVMNAIGSVIATLIGLSVGFYAGQQSITPDPVPTIAGQHCWNGWNPTQPKSHELICMVNK